MARSFNQAIIMGNLTRDPEMRTIPSGQNVTSFAVATNRAWQDSSGERKEAVDFHEVVAWGRLAELASQYLAKGRKVLVSGRLQTQSWEKDGVKQRRTEIVASDISFLDAPGGAASAAAPTGVAGEIPTVDINADKAEKPSPPAKPEAGGKAKKKSDDVVIEDLGDEPVNLDDIPF